MANCVVDATKGCAVLNEIKDHVVGAFMQVTSGILWDEILRGVRFNLLDVKYFVHKVRTGAGQILPCAKRVFFATQIASRPKLLEPIM